MSTDKFARLMNNCLQPFSFINPGGRILKCNTAFCQLTGYTEAELTALDKYWQINSPGYAEIEASAIKAVSSSGNPLRYESQYLHKDGHPLPVEVMLHQVSWGESQGLLYMLVSDLSELKREEELCYYFSYRDSLTGLYNWAYLEKELRRLSRDETNQGKVGIIIADIDGLKLINNSLGWIAGNELLIITATIVHEPFGDEELVARIGEDQFAVLLPNSSIRTLEKTCQRIRGGVARYNQNNPHLPLSLSLGYALQNAPGSSLFELISAADKKMYREKILHNRSASSGVVNALSKALELRDFITEGHGERLQQIVAQLGKEIGLPSYKIADLRLLGYFHDIGKIGIPDRILFKAGSLDMKEYEEVKRHCQIGYQIARAVPVLTPIAEWILKHHEWWNGCGYPLGLKEEEIPLECRILAIADAYDAMTSTRPYRTAGTPDAAITELQACAGRQFDPGLVASFIPLVKDNPGLN